MDESEDKIGSPSGPDGLLQLLIELANDGNLTGIAVTLNVAGAVVTGKVISSAEYTDGFAAFLGNGMRASKDEATVAVAATFESAVRSGAEGVPGDVRERRHAGVEVTVLPAYIHLRNARFLIGTQFVPENEGFLWRGRLSEVAGFAYGALRTGDAT